MRKLVLLVVILIMGIAFAGCQQGLSEAKVRSIVRQEVANQIASGQLEGIVGQEIAKQLASIDELTVSALYVKNNDGKIVALLQSHENGNASLELYNRYGKSVVWIGAIASDDGFLVTSDRYGEPLFLTPPRE